MNFSIDDLFLETINDLRAKSKSNRSYDLVRAAGLCRHLLLDKHTLYAIANRAHKCPLIFRVFKLSMSGIQNNPGKLIWTTIVPTHKSNAVEVRLREFLAIPFLRVEGYVYTVRQMIRAASHCMGGIHSYEPKGKREVVLKNLEKNSRTNHKTIHIAIAAICKVVIEAMEPLEAKILGKPLPKGL